MRTGLPIVVRLVSVSEPTSLLDGIKASTIISKLHAVIDELIEVVEIALPLKD